MKRSHRSGFTLIELMISVVVLSLALYSFGLAFKQGEQAYHSAHSVISLETRARQSLSRVIQEINGAGADMLWPDPSGDFGTSSLNFQKAVNVTDGAIDWGPMTRIAFVYAEGEVDDGVDNNGNGLIDEGAIELTRNVGGANERSVIICRGVAEFFPGEVRNGLDDNGNFIRDEQGFNAHLVGDMLTLRITLIALDVDGRPLTRTTTTSVRMRN